MSSNYRNDLQVALCQYITDTIVCMEAVSEFCGRSSDWLQQRKQESEKMRDIEEKLQKAKSETRADLEQQLSETLMSILTALDQLHWFVDAVEKLALSSKHVFQIHPLVILPEGGALEVVQGIITVAGLVCPQLIIFKRDFKVLFTPSPHNIQVQTTLLDQYIKAITIVSETLTHTITHLFTSHQGLPEHQSPPEHQQGMPEVQSTSRFSLGEPVIHEGLTEDQAQKMLIQIKALEELRMDAHFRVRLSFQGDSGSTFVTEFRERQARMLQTLEEMESAAEKLNSMKKGEKISSVVGLGGGVVSIVGLALAPFTAGTSVLLITGGALGITAGVNGLVTATAKYFVNRKQKKRAKQASKKFEEDMTIMQSCLDEVTTLRKADLKAALGLVKVLGSSGVPAVIRIAAEVPDLGQAAAKTAVTFSRVIRGGLIAVNSVFIVVDIIYIIKDSIHLAKGCKTEYSQLLRARVALFHSEIDMWQKLSVDLEKSQPTSEEHMALLQTPFYPEEAILAEVPDCSVPERSTGYEQHPPKESPMQCEWPQEAKGRSCSIQ